MRAAAAEAASRHPPTRGLRLLLPASLPGCFQCAEHRSGPSESRTSELLQVSSFLRFLTTGTSPVHLRGGQQGEIRRSTQAYTQLGPRYTPALARGQCSSPCQRRPRANARRRCQRQKPIRPDLRCIALHTPTCHTFPNRTIPVLSAPGAVLSEEPPPPSPPLLLSAPQHNASEHAVQPLRAYLILYTPASHPVC